MVPTTFSRGAFKRPAPPTLRACYTENTVPTEIEDEVTWLRHRIVRMRTILRFAKDARTEAGLRELIGEAEARLAALEARSKPNTTGR
jgi:hypothetical protein